jgi:hypothetical protein
MPLAVVAIDVPEQGVEPSVLAGLDAWGVCRGFSEKDFAVPDAVVGFRAAGVPPLATLMRMRIAFRYPGEVTRESTRERPRERALQRKSREPFHREILIGVGLCLLVFVVFANCLDGRLIFDSKGLILDDNRIKEATAQNLDLILSHSYWWHKGSSGLYRPLTTLSYLFNYVILGNGSDPQGYHVINILLHALNVLLVYALAVKLTCRFWPSAFLAAVWAVHPVVTEVVTNVAGRPDLLAAAGLLGAFLLYLKSAEAGGKARFGWLAGIAAATAIGVFSKENAVVIIAILIAYEALFWKNRRASLLLGCAAVLLPMQIMLYQRSVVLAAENPVEFPFLDNPIVAAPFWQAKLTALAVLGRSLRVVLWPLQLSADYSYHRIPLATGGIVDWLYWTLLAGAITIALVAGRRDRLVLFLGAFALITVLPTANLLFPIGAIMAERFLYLPSIAVLAMILAIAPRLGLRPGRADLARAAGAAVLLLLAARTWVRNRDWRDELSLSRATVTSAPESYKGHQMLAETIFLSDPEHKDIGSIINETEAGLSVLASVPDDRSNAEFYRLGGESYLFKAGQLATAGAGLGPGADVKRAIELLERGARILESARQRQRDELRARGIKQILFEASVNDDIYRLLSDGYLRLGNDDKAFDAAIEFRKRVPLSPTVYSQLARVLKASGQPEDAATALMEGMLVTSDMGLRQELIAFYRSGWAEAACAVVAGPNGPAINPACPLVHRNLCEATLDAIRIKLQTGRRDVASELHRAAVVDYGCAAGPLDDALAFGGGSH